MGGVPERLRELPKRPPPYAEFGRVHAPEDAEPPILAPAVRLAIRQWLLELSSIEALGELGLTPRRSMLLSGPPGCGKTTLAHHLAARLGLPLLVVDMQSLIGSHLGESARNIGKLFAGLAAHSDEIVLLLDEFDAVATKRTQDNQAGAREMNAVVIALLQAIDAHPGVVLAATNRADALDAALWRRFAMHVELREPAEDERFAILVRYLAPLALPDAALEALTAATAGAAPSLLRQLMEGVRRDHVLAPRFGQPADAAATFARILAAVQPHADAPCPPLWLDGGLRRVAGIPWPPARQKEGA